MSEIVVGDVLAWERGLDWEGDDASRMLPLTWAVTVLATPPALPQLRGGELIVVHRRTLDELQRVEMIQWGDVARSLAGQPIAGIMIEHGLDVAPPEGIPLLRADSDYIHDVEPRLNRTITEHRAELYRLGSDLSRALSVASIGGADLDALLAVAGEISKRDLVLLEIGGNVIARSRGAPRRLSFRFADLRPGEIQTGQGGWMLQQTRLKNGDIVSLAVGPGDAARPEAARLVLTQTLTAIEAFLGPAGVRRAGELPPSRETLLAEILLGRVPSSQLHSRLQALSIDSDEPYSVLLLQCTRAGFDGRIRTMLRREIRERICMLSPTEMAVIASESGWSDWWGELRVAVADEPDVVLTRSDPRSGFAGALHGTRQAQMRGLLLLSGIDAEKSVFDLLLPLHDPRAFPPSPHRLIDFADRLLAPLEAHDRERHGDLVETLRGYLAAGGSTTGAAELLNVHRNTLGYRLRRITALTGANLDSEDTRLAYGLALRIRRLGEMLG